MEFFKSNKIACKPVTTLQELFSWSHQTEEDLSRKYNVQKLKPQPKNRSQRQLIICHDMRNNYLDDCYFQGFNNPDDYTFYHWNLIDMFIYFSHHFVTIPPESWINAAHQNNVRMLGTFITEWKDGYEICDQLLKDTTTIDKCVDKLVALTLYYKFDGWLINIENKVENTEMLIYFVDRLTKQLRAIDPDLYKVIWYDSVVVSGELKWQNELNKLNETFFNVCDGIFVNYTWNFKNLENCATYTDRISDIYIGVDVFGRGVYGGGGFSTNLALEEIKKYNLSCAIFAPGWVLECNDPKKFIENNEKFWTLLRDHTETRLIHQLPILSTFTHSRSKEFFVYGKQVSPIEGWCSLNVQSLMPCPIETEKESDLVKWHFEDAFYGGSCLLLLANEESTVKLFDLDIKLEPMTRLKLDYSYKVDASKALEYHQKSDQLNIRLDYEIDGRKHIFHCNNSNSNSYGFEFIEMIDCVERTNRFGWHLKTLVIGIKKHLKLKCLSALNKGLNEPGAGVKLGFLRVLSTSDDPQVSLNPEIAALTLSPKNMKIFKLKSQIYLCLNLNWESFDSANRYYNLFIEENLRKISNEDSVASGQSLKYLGSSTLNEFRVCIKLNANVVLYESNMVEIKPKYSFDIYVQGIDNNLDNLISNGFSADSMIFASCGSAKKLTVPLSKFNIREETVLDFIDEIIFDMESF